MSQFSRPSIARLKKQNQKPKKGAVSPDIQPDIQPDEDAQIRDCIAQSEIFCEQARQAARCKRFEAARGLFSTAVVLCRRALSFLPTNKTGDKPDHKSENPARIALKRHLDYVLSEMAAHAQLARSMQRPMHTPAKLRVDAPAALHSSTRNLKRPRS